MFEIDGKVLRTEEWSVSFPDRIYEVLEFRDVFLAVLYFGVGKNDFNNVFAVKNGEVIWQIQDSSEINPNFERVDKFYAGVRVYEDDPRFVIATSNGGFRFVIDPLTGRIVKQESAVR